MEKMGNKYFTKEISTMEKNNKRPNEVTQILNTCIDDMEAGRELTIGDALKSPADIFSELCQNGAENTMTDEDVYNIVSKVRAERNDPML